MGADELADPPLPRGEDHDQLACLLAGAEPVVAVAGGPSAALADAVAGAEAVGDAGEGVVLALPRAHPRLHRHHPAAAAVVCVHVVSLLIRAVHQQQRRSELA